MLFDRGTYDIRSILFYFFLLNDLNYYKLNGLDHNRIIFRLSKLGCLPPHSAFAALHKPFGRISYGMRMRLEMGVNILI